MKAREALNVGMLGVAAVLAPLAAAAATAAGDGAAPARKAEARELESRRPQPGLRTLAPAQLWAGDRFKRQRTNPRYLVVPMKANPLLSSEYPATPEYEYLYTPTATTGSVPPVARYSYAPDNTYLLRPALVSRAAASAYAWTYSRLYLGTLSPASASLGSAQSSLSRNPGQKGDNLLKPFAVAPMDRQAVQDSPSIRGPLRLDRP
jgi:hypothetical protein